MAYKFQIGAARLSGSIIQSDGTGDLRATTVDSLVSEATIDATGLASLDGGIDVNGSNFTVSAAGAVVAVGISAGGAISNATTVSGSGAFSALSLNLDSVAVTSTAAELNLLDGITRGSIVYGNAAGGSARLAKGTAGQFVVSDGDDIIYRSMSADATLAANGALTIANDAVSLAKMAGITRGSIISGDASGDPQYLAKGNASEFLQSDGTDVAYIAMSGDATLSAGAITLASAQTNVATMTNAALVVGRDADNKIDFGTDDVIKFNTAGAERMTIGATGDVTVEGNFKVKGTTTTIESTVLKVKDQMIELNVVTGSEGRASNAGAGLFLSGSTVANDASLILAADGGRFKASGSAAGFDIQTGGDYRINNAAVLTATTLGGAVVNSSLTNVGALDGGSIASGFTKINVANVLDVASIDIDGATDIGAAVAAADLLIIDDGAGGTNRKVTMARIKTFVETGASPAEAVKDLSGNNAPVTGVNYYASNLGTTQTVTLPASAGMSDGQKVRIKAPSDCSSTVKVVINRSGSQLMDGNLESISLESPFAAVELVYVSANAWRIF